MGLNIEGLEHVSTMIRSNYVQGELIRIRNQVDTYGQAVEFAREYDLQIVDVSHLKENLKFDITYVKYKGV